MECPLCHRINWCTCTERELRRAVSGCNPFSMSGMDREDELVKRLREKQHERYRREDEKRREEEAADYARREKARWEEEKMREAYEEEAEVESEDDAHAAREE